MWRWQSGTSWLHCRKRQIETHVYTESHDCDVISQVTWLYHSCARQPLHSSHQLALSVNAVHQLINCCSYARVTIKDYSMPTHYRKSFAWSEMPGIVLRMQSMTIRSALQSINCASERQWILHLCPLAGHWGITEIYFLLPKRSLHVLTVCVGLDGAGGVGVKWKCNDEFLNDCCSPLQSLMYSLGIIRRLAPTFTGFWHWIPNPVGSLSIYWSPTPLPHRQYIGNQANWSISLPGYWLRYCDTPLHVVLAMLVVYHSTLVQITTIWRNSRLYTAARRRVIRSVWEVPCPCCIPEEYGFTWKSPAHPTKQCIQEWDFCWARHLQ